MNMEIARHRREIEALCRRHGVRSLELFGSAARAGVEPSHDLDFLVEFVDSPPGGYADAYFSLLEALEGLFGCPVDLVSVSSLVNPYFRESVEETKVRLYAA